MEEHLPNISKALGLKPPEPLKIKRQKKGREKGKAISLLLIVYKLEQMTYPIKHAYPAVVDML